VWVETKSRMATEDSSTVKEHSKVQNILSISSQIWVKEVGLMNPSKIFFLTETHESGSGSSASDQPYPKFLSL
jgi:hypothetical protein